MKTHKIYLGIIAIILIFGLASCSLQLDRGGYDDVYYNHNDPEQYKELEKRTSSPSSSEKEKNSYAKKTREYNEKLRNNNSNQDYQGADANNYGSEQATANNEKLYASSYQGYDEDDYYDYAYTARIRRFHRPYVWIGYYDDYYTNLYWYTYNPYYWGTSIYLGYSWWYPSYSSWYNPYFYNPYHYSPYWGYYPYGWGYYPYYGFNNSYYYNNVAYYNARDNNSYFNRSRTFDANYGRRSLATSTKGNREEDSRMSFGDRYNSRYGNSISSERTSAARTLNSTSVGNNTRSFERANNNSISNGSQRRSVNNSTESRFDKPARIENRTISSDRRISNSNMNNRQSVNQNIIQSRDNRSFSRDNQNNQNSRTYTPPANRQPRTNNEFRNNDTRRSIEPQRINQTTPRSSDNSSRPRSTYTPSSSQSTRSSSSSSSRETRSSSSSSGGTRSRR